MRREPSGIGESGEEVVAKISDVCARVDTSQGARAEAAGDMWPLGIHLSAAGARPGLPAAVARPGSAREVAAVLAACNEHRVPVTAAAGRSGVCGGAAPCFGGISLDLRGLSGVSDVDADSLLVECAAGTPGLALEQNLRREHGLTLGHWPQSLAISTAGGWVACRSAGQYSTRYGKIEDMVAAAEVALADGRLVRLGGAAPRSAMGPDLLGCFVGSEGVLGVLTSVRLRARPLPPTERKMSWLLSSFPAGIDACRRTLRRGATPAVLRLYDPAESARTFGQGDGCVLVVLDEAEPAIAAATMSIVAEELTAAGAAELGAGPVDRWLATRGDVPPLDALAAGGVLADTVEVAGRWGALASLAGSVVDQLASLEGTFTASVHLSHAYPDGACLYFTFAGQSPARAPDLEWAAAYYRRAWDTVMSETLNAGCAISHHHGIGANRGRYMRAALGGGFEVLRSLKDALDPNGILNPGKLGLPSPWGPPWG